MRRFSTVLAAALVSIGATGAAAQTQTPAGVPPADGRITVFLNGGFQVNSQDIGRTSTFDLYDEQARIDFVQDDVEGGGFFEIGGAYRFGERLGAGLSFMRVTSDGGSVANGSIPHPLVFDQFRSFSVSADGLDHKENIVHLFATWLMPVTEQLDVTFSAGPSFFNISQGFIRTVSFTETPPFTNVNVDRIEIDSRDETAVGFNFGADASYSVGRFGNADLGVGANVRYSWGKADFDIAAGDELSVKGGGFQIGGGVRVRF
ncbi:MAG TPA: hypothetical protein VGD94_17475 [Vicinamibacterales bacterium]